MSQVGWTLTFGDRVFHESDLTLGQAVRIQELTGQPWPRWPIASAQDLASILAVCLADGDLDESIAQVAGLNMLEAMAMVEPGEE